MADGDVLELGRGTRERLLWAEECAALGDAGIGALGVSDARAGYRFARAAPAKAVLVATLGGRGRALVDGAWRALTPGTVLLAPPRAAHAYATDGARWRMCWIHWREDAARTLFAGASAPVVGAGDGGDLAHAIEGLVDEHHGHADGAIVARWVDLARALAERLARRWRAPARLAALWRAVEADLGRRWTLAELGRIAGLRDEALRVACARETGRSPLRQVAWLRMRRAAGLLRDGLAVNAVAAHLGYDDPFAFSAAFKRATGRSPSTLRVRSVR